MGSSRGGTWDLDQTRSHNAVNELISLTGGAWINPQYDPAGNMTTMPQPKAPTASYDARYDAWNRLVKLTNGSLTVAEYTYNGLFHRVAQKSYHPTTGALTEARRYYYNPAWQVLEERVGTPGTTQGNYAERQFLWDIRYIDSMVCRWRDTDLNGSSDQTLYALNDANMNVTAIVDTSGGVVERYTYDPYGKPTFRAPDGAVRTYGGNYQWETLYAGYRLEIGTGLHHVRFRVYHPQLGRWGTREPRSNWDGGTIYTYTRSNSIKYVDYDGMETKEPGPTVIKLNAEINICIAYDSDSLRNQQSESHKILIQDSIDFINGLIGEGKECCRTYGVTCHIKATSTWLDKSYKIDPPNVTRGDNLHVLYQTEQVNTLDRIKKDDKCNGIPVLITSDRYYKHYDPINDRNDSTLGSGQEGIGAIIYRGGRGMKYKSLLAHELGHVGGCSKHEDSPDAIMQRDMTEKCLKPSKCWCVAMEELAQ